jgi:hypothetical protein
MTYMTKERHGRPSNRVDRAQRLCYGHVHEPIKLVPMHYTLRQTFGSPDSPCYGHVKACLSGGLEYG